MKDKNITKKVNDEYYLQNGILILDSIKSLDYKEQEYLINKYPISPQSLIDELYNLENLRPLFEFAVDNNLCELKNSIFDYDGTKIKAKNINDYIKYSVYYILFHKEHRLNPNYLYFYKDSYEHKSVAEVLKPFREFISTEKEKEKIVNEISREYLISLLDSNEEMFVIKFCKRLETYLKFKISSTHTFEENLTIFTNSYMCKKEYSEILHDVRKLRNNIVHSTVDETQKISKDTYIELIDYICSL